MLTLDLEQEGSEGVGFEKVYCMKVSTSNSWPRRLVSRACVGAVTPLHLAMQPC